MDKVKFEIDGVPVKAGKDMTILRIARREGIDIPTLCHNRYLEPYGGCRLCLVELHRNNRTRLVASCVYPVEEGLVIKTDSDRLRKIRRTLLELILPLSPTGPVEALAAKYGVKESRFTADPNRCLLCGICVRYCSEIKKANAIGFVGRGINRSIAFFPEIASKNCPGCRKCYGLCLGGKLVKETDGISFTQPFWSLNGHHTI